jgi:hypothetical protein
MWYVPLEKQIDAENSSLISACNSAYVIGILRTSSEFYGKVRTSKVS